MTKTSWRSWGSGRRTTCSRRSGTSYDLCGQISEEASKLTGLPAGTAVAGGMFDIDACAVAVDVTSPERMCTIAGTWSINEYISEKPIMDGSVAMNSLFAMPGYYLVEECSATSSGNLEWYLENCMDHEPIPEGENIYSIVNDKVASVKPEECDVYFLPFLYGSNAHPLGKGAFIGLTTYHNKAHMLRAIYEGVAYSTRRTLRSFCPRGSRRRRSGWRAAACNSKVWVQMFADILGFPMETVDAKELGALGCGMAAAIAAGVYKDYREAAEHMVHVSGRVEPNPAMREIYEKKYKKIPGRQRGGSGHCPGDSLKYSAVMEKKIF